jgi:two-component system KDP operon response regulator KdpE
MPGKTVLIADDDPGMVEFLTMTLQTMGLEVDSAITTEELVQKLRAATPDLVVMDMGMPGLDEKMPAMDIRKRTQTRAKILIVSGREIANERKLGHLQGSQGAIQKDAGMDPIIAAAQELLK